MDPRTAASQPQPTVIKRKLAVLPIAEVKPVSEVEIPADAVLFGLSKSPFGLMAGVSEGSAPIKRKLWIVGLGGDVAVDAQHGDYLGDAYLPSVEEPSKLVLVVAFIETQKQAIDRARHYGHRPTP